MANGVMCIHQRLAELYVLNKRRALTPEEMSELQHCLTENVKYCWEMAYLENMSLMASMTNDMDWQHEICRDIDNVGLPKRKTPRKRKGDRTNGEDNGR